MKSSWLHKDNEIERAIRRDISDTSYYPSWQKKVRLNALFHSLSYKVVVLIRNTTEYKVDEIIYWDVLNDILYCLDDYFDEI